MIEPMTLDKIFLGDSKFRSNQMSKLNSDLPSPMILDVAKYGTVDVVRKPQVFTVGALS